MPLRVDTFQLTTAQNRVLDSGPMYYWRKLFIVVLLALSLPAQSFAPVAMKCGVGQAHHHSAHVAPEGGEHHAAMSGAEHLHASGDHHHDGHQAHACATCASCCSGAVMLSVPILPPTAETAHFFLSPSSSAPVVSFLTGGIERPPRSILV